MIAESSQQMYQSPKSNRHFWLLFHRYLFLSFNFRFCLLLWRSRWTSTTVTSDCSLPNVRQTGTSQPTVNENEFYTLALGGSCWFSKCIAYGGRSQGAEFMGNKQRNWQTYKHSTLYISIQKILKLQLKLQVLHLCFIARLFVYPMVSRETSESITSHVKQTAEISKFNRKSSQKRRRVHKETTSEGWWWQNRHKRDTPIYAAYSTAREAGAFTDSIMQLYVTRSIIYVPRHRWHFWQSLHSMRRSASNYCAR